MLVLIVDDEYEKVERISSILKAQGMVDVSIEHQANATSARKYLRGARVDLLIIDLLLPESVGEPASKNGGLRFFDMVCGDLLCEVPATVLFLTSQEDLAASLEEEIRGRGALVCRFDSSSTHWSDFIVRLFTFALDRERTNMARNGGRVDIAVVTALRIPELEAVLALPYGWKQLNIGGEVSNYHIGRIETPSSVLRVVAAHAQRKGMSSAASLASRMTVLFRPRYLVMLGICAGMPSKTNFGDVVVGNPVWDWGSGKMVDGADGVGRFELSPYQQALRPSAEKAVLDAAARADVGTAVRSGWTEDFPTGKFAVHVGPMASGSSVLADGKTMQTIRDQHRDLLAVEMEAYAVMAAAEYCSDPSMCSIALKSVCDFGNAAKANDWQRYAAFTSARFFDYLFKNRHLE